MSLKLDRKIIKYAITGWIPASFMTSQNEIKKINETDNRFNRPRRTIYFLKKRERKRKPGG